MPELMTTNHDLWDVPSVEQPAILMSKVRGYHFACSPLYTRGAESNLSGGLTMVNSKRLTSLMGQIIFITMILPSFLSASELSEARTATRSVLVALVLLYTGLTTGGWVRVNRRRSFHLLQAYFATALGLVMIINLAIASVSSEGTITIRPLLVPSLETDAIARLMIMTKPRAVAKYAWRR